MSRRMTKKNNKSEERLLGGRRGWLAMGTLAAYAVVGSSKLALAAVRRMSRRVPSAPASESAGEAVQYCGGAAGCGD